MRIYGARDFEDLCNQSVLNPRMRQHLNIHDDYSDPCQRLFIAIQPNSYVVPHRHTAPAKSETFIVLRGSIGIVFFDDDGQVTDTAKLGPHEESQVCDILPGTWHTAIALQENSVFMEVKPGPFCPLEPVDFAAWAPKEEAAVNDFLSVLYERFK